MRSSGRPNPSLQLLLRLAAGKGSLQGWKGRHAEHHACASSIQEHQAQLQSRGATAAQLVQRCLEGLHRAEPSVSSFLTVQAEAAMSQVRVCIGQGHVRIHARMWWRHHTGCMCVFVCS